MLAPRVGLEAERLVAALERWRPKVSSAGTPLALRQGARFGARGCARPNSMDGRSRSSTSACSTDRPVDAGERRGLPRDVHVGVDRRCACGHRLPASIRDGGAAPPAQSIAGSRWSRAAPTVSTGWRTGLRWPVAESRSRFSQAVPTGSIRQGTRPCRPRSWSRVRSSPSCRAASRPLVGGSSRATGSIAAASLATVVVEAGSRSGSLNTAHHAAHLGRPLGAVPGPVTSRGRPDAIASSGEGLAECVTDAGELAALVLPPPRCRRAQPQDHDATRVLDALSSRSSQRTARCRATVGPQPAREVTGILGRLSSWRGWWRATCAAGGARPDEPKGSRGRMDGAAAERCPESPTLGRSCGARSRRPRDAAIAAATDIGPARRVLDVGAAPASSSPRRKGAGVIAGWIDPAPAMVEHARRRSPNADIRLGDAEHLLLGRHHAFDVQPR